MGPRGRSEGIAEKRDQLPQSARHGPNLPDSQTATTKKSRQSRQEVKIPAVALAEGSPSGLQSSDSPTKRGLQLPGQVQAGPGAVPDHAGEGGEPEAVGQVEPAAKGRKSRESKRPTN